MAAREDDVVEDEMDDQTCDQTGQISAGQVSNSENKVHTFSNSKLQNVFKIKAKRSFPDAPILNCQTKLQNG